jgi:hypothetical protein
MSTMNPPEPTNEQLWAQPPLAAPGTAPVSGQHLAPIPAPAPLPIQPGRATGTDKTTFSLAIVSLGVGIPLTAIASDAAGIVGLIVSWVGIVAVNLVYAWGRRR